MCVLPSDDVCLQTFLFLNLLEKHSAECGTCFLLLAASLFLVAMPGAPSSFLLLLVRHLLLVAMHLLLLAFGHFVVCFRFEVLDNYRTLHGRGALEPVCGLEHRRALESRASKFRTPHSSRLFKKPLTFTFLTFLYQRI